MTSSMDYYQLDKHCASISLSPPVISSTSSCMPENGSGPDLGYLGAGGNPGGGYRAVVASGDNNACLMNAHPYAPPPQSGGVTSVNVKCEVDDMFGDTGGGGDYVNMSTYYPGLDSTSLHHNNLGHGHQANHHHHQAARASSHHKKHPSSSSPYHAQLYGPNCGMYNSSKEHHGTYDGGGAGPPGSAYSMQPQQQQPQSTTSPMIKFEPDSPPLVSSATGGNGYGHHHSSHHQRGSPPSSMCIAKKSTSVSSNTTIPSSPTTSNTNGYELKREIAESSGLSINGAPYVKSRAGRKASSSNMPGAASSTATVGAKSDNSSNQFTDADSNSGNPSLKTFVPCKVCGDKASGYHYGVTSCEGCKGFFRRSIQKQIEYRCLRDGKCLIIRLNRNRCQYCRFKKCIAVGMSRDSVRYGRVPKKSKEKERLGLEEKANGITQAEADQSSTSEQDQPMVDEAKDLALYDTILTISQAHHANCSYTDDKIKGLAKKPIYVLSQMSKSSDDCSSPDIGSVSESLELKKIELWEHLSVLITPCIQRVVEFAKRIPGFCELTQDDQLILIKLGFFEVWLVHISKTADCVESTLTFADGSYLSRKQLELMFDHEFVGNLFHLMSGLNNLKLNDTEVGLFAAIILLQSDRAQIYDIKAINKNQEYIVEALKTQLTRNHPGQESDIFQKLMMRINELRGLGSSHSMHLQWFRSNWSRLKLPPLFAEIFDIPRTATAYATMQQASLASPTASASAISSSASNNNAQMQAQQHLDAISQSDAASYVTVSDVVHHAHPHSNHHQHVHHNHHHHLHGQQQMTSITTADSEAISQTSETITSPISISVDNNLA